MSIVEKHHPFSARWIWTNDDGTEPNQYRLFRRSFELKTYPEFAKLHITADTGYRVWVNDILVGQGPPQSMPYRTYYDTHDVTSFLQHGANVIAVVVNYVGRSPDTRGGLLAALVDNNDRILCATDSTWTCDNGNAWSANSRYYGMNQLVPYQEMFDARLMPAGWRKPEFDDYDWPQATEIASGGNRVPLSWTAPWSMLVPRDIPLLRHTFERAQSIAYAEECQGILGPRWDDLTVGLSTPGREVTYSQMDGLENLCRRDGDTYLCRSTEHLRDHTFNGIFDPCVVLDFGRIITGYLEIELEAEEGAVMDFGYAERLVDGHFNNTYQGLFADRYTTTEGHQTWRFFGWKAFRYLKLRLRGQCERSIRIKDLRVIHVQYPFEKRGDFESNETVLNQTYKICRDTIDLCSKDALMDTPWREAAQWLGDAVLVTVPGVYACFGDTALPAKFFRQCAGVQTPAGPIANRTAAYPPQGRAIADYSLWWIQAVWAHYLYTGEETWIERLYPAACRIMQFFWQYADDEDGLISDPPYSVLLDWAAIERRDKCAACNAIYFGTLSAMLQMAETYGDARMAAHCKKAQQQIEANFADTFYDKQQGVFRDAVMNGELSPNVSEHANTAAMRFNLTSKDMQKSIIRALYEEKTVPYVEAQPFFTSVVLQALAHVERFDLALDVIRDRWGRRMVERGATSTFEEWGDSGSWRSGTYSGVMLSQSHAWSAAPADFLTRYLIGLEILEPGCGSVRLAPHKTDFHYTATYPTPAGDITVICQNGKITIHSPHGMSVDTADS